MILWVIGGILLTMLIVLLIKPSKKQSGLYTWFKTSVPIKPSQREEILWEMERLQLQDTPEDLKARQWMMGSIAFTIFAAIALILWEPFFLLLGIGVTFFFYTHPIRRLNALIRRKNEGVNDELPDFIDLITLLMRSGMTPYQAIKQIAEQSHFIYLKSDIRRLSTDIDAYGIKEGLDHFEKYVGTYEAKQFVRSMLQVMVSDRERAEELFKNITDSMRQFRQLRNRKRIKETPLKVRMVSMGVLGFIIAIPMGVFVINFIKLFSSMGG